MNNILLVLLLFSYVSCLGQRSHNNDKERYEQLKKMSDRKKSADEKFSKDIRELQAIKFSLENVSFRDDLSRLYIALQTLQDINQIEAIVSTGYYKKLESLKIKESTSWNKDECEQVSKFYLLIYNLLKSKDLDEKDNDLLGGLVHDIRILLDRRNRLIKGE